MRRRGEHGEWTQRRRERRWRGGQAESDETLPDSPVAVTETRSARTLSLTYTDLYTPPYRILRREKEEARILINGRDHGRSQEARPTRCRVLSGV